MVKDESRKGSLETRDCLSSVMAQRGVIMQARRGFGFCLYNLKYADLASVCASVKWDLKRPPSPVTLR